MKQPAELGVRPDLRADSDREVAAYSPRRRAGGRTGVKCCRRMSARMSFGNPPFGGAKFQSTGQRSQVRRIAALGGSGGTLDYVAAWFIRAGEYVRRTQHGEQQSATEDSASSQPTRLPKASRSRSCGRCCLTATVWRSPLPTGRLPGVLTPAARPTCMWSSSDWTRQGMRHGTGGCSPTRTSTGSRLKAATPWSRPYLFDGGALAKSPPRRPRRGQADKRTESTGSPALSPSTMDSTSSMLGSDSRSWMPNRTQRRFYAHSSALVSTCKVASVGFLRCMTLRRLLWRNYHGSENASPPFVPTAVRVKASRRRN